MKILIVEDNKNKLQKLIECIHNIKKEIRITEANSFTSGVRKIREDNWDLIILDMTLPTYDVTHREYGGDKKSVAGKEIMKKMLHRNILIPVVIVTQFEEFGENRITLDILNSEFEKDFKDIWIRTIFYEGNKWQNDLVETIQEIIMKEETK